MVFNLGWLPAGAVQTGGYSVASHDVSDLAALTAQAPLVMLPATGIAGVLTIAFALFAPGAPRPRPRAPGTVRSTSGSPWSAPSRRSRPRSPWPPACATRPAGTTWHARQVFGALFLAVLEGKPGGGYLQRAAILLASVGVATLTLGVHALAGSPAPDASRSAVE